MKINKGVITVVVLFGLIDQSQGQSPEVYNNPVFQPPLPPSSMQYRSFGRIWVEKGMDQDGYKLLVHTSKDMDTKSIQVRIAGRSIIIESKQSFHQEERSDSGFYNYSSSSSNFRRRFSIPRDADIENMNRVDSAGVIIITLPFLYSSIEQQ